MAIQEDLFWSSPKSFGGETNFGGYLKFAKESLKLSKRSKKFLGEIYGLHKREEIKFTPLVFECEFSSLFKIFSFYRDYNSQNKKATEFPNWQEPLTLNKLFAYGKDKKFKEKLKITQDQMNLLKNLKIRNETKSLLVEIMKEKSFTDYNFNNLISLPQTLVTKSISQSFSKECMPSKIQNNLELLGEESLNYVDSVQICKISEVAFEPNLDAIYKLFLDLTLITYKKTKSNNKENQLQTNLLKFINWDFNNQLNYNKLESVLKNLESKLLDIQFSEYELYKLPINRINSKEMYSKARKDNRLKKKNYWNLDKIQLKQLNWDPFKLFRLISLETFLAKDSISPKEVNFKKSLLTFPKLFCSQLDLIILNNLDGKNGIRKLPIPINDSENQTNQDGTKSFIQVADSRQQSFEENVLSLGKIENGTNTILTDTNSEIMNTTSMLPQKRSFLDSGLLSILSKKRQKHEDFTNYTHLSKSDNAVESTINEDFTKLIVPELELLNIGLITENKPIEPDTRDKSNHSVEENDKLKEKIAILEEDVIISNLVDWSIEIQDYLIIANSNQLIKNHQLINKISNVQDTTKRFHIVENPIKQPVDFVLNYQTCLIRIDITKFFQIDKSDNLFYYKLLSKLIPEYKTIVIVLEYRKEFVKVDPDILWKILLFLPEKQFKLVYVEQNNDNLIQIMQCIIHEYGNSQLQETEITDILATVPGKILTQLRLDPLSVCQILKNYTLLELICHLVNNDTAESLDVRIYEWFTDTQLERLTAYIALQW